MYLEISASATADAGKDTATCLGAPVHLTDSHAFHYASLLWTTTGNGTFTDPFDLHPWYTPGPYDLTVDHVNLTLTAYSGTSCPSDTNTMQLLIMTAASANAGPDLSTCGSSSITITGSSAANYDSLHWTSSGTGYFSDPSILHPVYFPGWADPGLGQITLTLYAGAPQPCAPAIDQLELALVQPVIAYAGPNRTICQGTSLTIAGATAMNYSSIAWTHNGTGTLAQANTISPTYIPSYDETGTVTLTLHVYPISPCQPVTSSMVLTITTAPVADAGPDGSVCNGSSFQVINASAQNASAFTWTTQGDGTFSDQEILNPVYTPGTSDISSGDAILTLTAEGDIHCIPSIDHLILHIIPKPIADAGPDGQACLASTIYITGATASNYTTVSWTTTGLGILADANTLAPVYSESSADTGSVSFILTATGTSQCSGSQVSDQTTYYLYETLAANTGPDQTITYNTATALSSNPSGGSGHYSFDWQPAAFLVDHTVQNPQTIPLNASMSFLLSVGDLICERSLTDSVRIIVGPKETSEDCLIIHNVITPNGDGLNDKWIIDCIDAYPENTVTIFNRWGENVNNFEHYNNSTVTWDGKNYSGELLPDGTYYYILKIKEGGTYSGWVFLRSGSK